MKKLTVADLRNKIVGLPDDTPVQLLDFTTDDDHDANYTLDVEDVFTVEGVKDLDDPDSDKMKFVAIQFENKQATPLKEENAYLKLALHMKASIFYAESIPYLFNSPNYKAGSSVVRFGTVIDGKIVAISESSEAEFKSKFGCAAKKSSDSPSADFCSYCNRKLKS